MRGVSNKHCLLTFFICSRRHFQILPHFQKLQIRHDISWESSTGRRFSWNIIPYFYWKLGKMLQNLSSAAVVIATLRVKLLHASRKFCCLLMIFANNLDPDQARKMLGLIWIQAVWHWCHFWKNILKKVLLKNICRDQTIMENYPACREIKLLEVSHTCMILATFRENLILLYTDNKGS